MTLLRTLFEWVVLIPGALLAYVLACAIGLIPLLAAPLSYDWVVGFFEPRPSEWSVSKFPRKPTSRSTWIIAVVVGLYIFLITAAAVYYLPHVLASIWRAA